MPVNELFKYENQEDSEYNLIKDKCPDVQDKLNNLYVECKSYLDRDFPKKIGEDFHARVWELSLCKLLLDNKLQVQTSNQVDGPDFHIIYGGKDIYIEAVCPQAKDSVIPMIGPEDLKNGTGAFIFGDVDFSKTEMRLSSAIYEKKKKYDGYIQSKRIKSDSVKIIALSSSRIIIPKLDLDPSLGEFALILRTLLPLGGEYIEMNRESRALSELKRYIVQENYNKNQSPISKRIFLNDEEYKEISAVIFCPELYAHSNPDKCIIIKNPFAKNKLQSNLGFREINIIADENQFRIQY